jgi:hypothetical protein
MLSLLLLSTIITLSVIFLECRKYRKCRKLSEVIRSFSKNYDIEKDEEKTIIG